VSETGDNDQSKRGRFDRLRDFYRRRPVAAWGATAVAAGVVVAVIVIAAVGGSGEPANVAIKCTAYQSDDSVSLTFVGKVTQKEADEGCGSVAQQLSSVNSYWRTGTPPLPESEPELTCALEAPAEEKVSGVVYIESNPESFSGVGTHLCGLFAHGGWTETLAPTGSVWIHAWRAEQQRVQAVEEEERAEQEAVEEQQAQETEERQAEEDREQEAWTACETDAQEKLEEEREAIQAEYEPLETGDAEHIYEVQEAAEELELEAESRELHSIGKCQRRVENRSYAEPEPGQSGVINPEAGTEYR
jgi:hypothetical protein